MAGAVDTARLADTWAAQRGLSKGRLSDAAQAALAWLLEQAIDLTGPLAPIIRAIRTDGYLVGAHAAATVLRIEPPDWSSWTPGDTAAAQRILGEAGDGQGLADMLADVDTTIRSVAATRFADLARVLADAVAAGDSPGTLARALRGVLEAPGWAQTVAVTETTRAVSAATLDRYEDNGIDKASWLVAPDQRVCPLCEANAADGPLPLGKAFTSGAAYPPQHPHCRCALLPDLGIDLDKASGRYRLRDYWLTGEGAAKWSTWTELYQHLSEHVPDGQAKRMAAQWYHDRYGKWPGQHGDHEHRG